MTQFNFPGMTPGPWRYSTIDLGQYQIIPETVFDESVAICRNSKNNEANARAIAALPDILLRLAKLENVLRAVRNLPSEKGHDGSEKLCPYCRLERVISACHEEENP